MGDVERLAVLFSGLGVKKVRLTGGEPMVRRDLLEIVKVLKKHFEWIAITTNGTLLTRRLAGLAEAGLNTINISLDSLVPVKNEFITRRLNTTEAALKNIDLAVELGLQTKVNVVAMRNFNDDEFADFAALTENLPIDVRFIEFMPFNSNDWKTKKFISEDDIMSKIKERFAQLDLIPTEKSSTSRIYQITGHKGRVGFISSMSKHFCGGCNRLRITADGNLKVCLFDNNELNLKDLLASHSDEELFDVLQGALGKKKFSHGGVDSILARENRPMVRIGG